MSDQPTEFVAFPSGGWTTGMPDGIGETPWDEIPQIDVPDIGEPGSDAALELRKTMGRFATGVTVITTEVAGQVHGMTANAFMSVSLAPPLVLVSVDRRARMNRHLNVGATYGVNVLAENQATLSDHFARRAVEGGEEPSFVAVRDTPLIEGALAHVVARVCRTYWGGDHTLFLGQVEYARYGEGRPLLFHGGQYDNLSTTDLPLLDALTPATRELLMEEGEQHEFEPGSIVLHVGATGDAFYLIQEGSVRVQRNGMTVARMGPGEFFGEVAVIDGGPWTADVIADTELRCIRIPRDAVRDALRKEPEAAWEVLRVLAARFRSR